MTRRPGLHGASSASELELECRLTQAILQRDSSGAVGAVPSSHLPWLKGCPIRLRMLRLCTSMDSGEAGTDASVESRPANGPAEPELPC